MGQENRLLQVELVEHNPGHSATGIGRYTRELYSRLSRLSDRVSVRLTSNIDPPLANRLTFLHHLPVGVRRHQPGSIVHFTQIMGCSQMLWHPVRPAVATVHDLGVLVCKEDEQLFNRFDRWMLDLQLAGLRRMDHYAVNSDHTRRALAELLGVPNERIHFVQLGVDAQHFRPIPNARKQIAERYSIKPMEDTFDLLYVGSELPRKNVGLLLEAIAVLKTRGYHLRLIKVGGAGGRRWRAKFLSDVERLELTDDVVIVGVVPEEDLPLFYNTADLCVTPTLLEGGFAWLVMEAMACQKPVVATYAALVPPEAEEAVMLVPPRNLDELVAAIAKCLDDEEMRLKMGEAGRRIIASYTWEATAQAMIEVYKAATSGACQ